MKFWKKVSRKWSWISNKLRARRIIIANLKSHRKFSYFLHVQISIFIISKITLRVDAKSTAKIMPLYGHKDAAAATTYVFILFLCRFVSYELREFVFWSLFAVDCVREFGTIWSEKRYSMLTLTWFLMNRAMMVLYCRYVWSQDLYKFPIFWNR